MHRSDELIWSKINGLRIGSLNLLKKSITSLLCLSIFIQNSLLAAELPKTGQSNKTSLLSVEGTGDTFEAAKKQAFRTAIQQAVGVLSISEQAADGDQLTKDQINEYSAGYIDDYEVVESHRDADNRTVISMRVRVASSKIAQRMMSRGDTISKVQGQKMATQLESQIDSRNDGDAMLSEVLSSYPQNAFIINQGISEVRISPTRKPYFIVPYEVTMSKFWADGLNEALTAVSATSHSCNNITLSISNNSQQPGAASLGQSFCGGPNPDMRIITGSGFFSSTASSYNFHDVQTLAMVNEHLNNSTNPRLKNTIAIQVEFASDTRVFRTSCINIPFSEMIGYYEPTYHVEYNSNLNRQYMRPLIDSRVTMQRTIKFDVPSRDELAELTNVRFTVQQSCS